MPTVPQIIHFIWLGGPIPDTSAENILDWKEKCQDYRVIVWFDSMHLLAGRLRSKMAKQAKREAEDITAFLPPDERARAAEKHTQALLQKVQPVFGGDSARTTFMAERSQERHGGELKPASHYTRMKFDAMINFEKLGSNGVIIRDARDIMPGTRLSKLYENELSDRNVNFGGSSDMLRYEILYRDGGVYADVDIALLKPLPEIAVDSKSTVLWGLYDGKISNALIACCPGASMMLRTIHIVQAKYDQLATDEDLREYYRANVRQSTVMMTGPTVASQSIEKTLARSKGIKNPKLPLSCTLLSEEMRPFEDELNDFRQRFVFPKGYVDFEARPEAKVHKWLVANANEAVQAAAAAAY